jgi:hypothetical protein
MLAFAGCATTDTTTKENQSTDRSDYARQWDDMSPVERAESVLWEPFQYALLFGGYALGGH